MRIKRINIKNRAYNHYFDNLVNAKYILNQKYFDWQEKISTCDLFEVATSFSYSKSRRIEEIQGDISKKTFVKKWRRMEEILRTFRDFQKKGKL